MTGRYEFNAHHTPHFLDQGRDPKKQGLPLTEPTLADRMRAAEYATGIVGKWRLGSEDIRFHPLRCGFQELYGFLDGGHSYLPADHGYGDSRRRYGRCRRWIPFRRFVEAISARSP